MEKRKNFAGIKENKKPDLLEYGDRYEMTPLGNSFIHVPTRMEVIEDLKSTGFIVENRCIKKKISRTNQIKFDNFRTNADFGSLEKLNKTTQLPPQSLFLKDKEKH